MPFRPDQQQAAPSTGRFRPDAAQTAPRKYDPLSNDESSLPPLPGENVTRVNAAPANPEPPYGTKVMDALAAPGGDMKNPLAGVYGLAENAATTVTGAVAPAIAGARGAFTGKEPTNADIEDFTYSPRTAQGKWGQNVMNEVAAPAVEFAQELGVDQALLPMAGEMNALNRKPSAKQKMPTSAETKAAPTKKARASGVKLSPSEEAAQSGNKNYVGRALEGLAGKTDVQREMSSANKKLFTKSAEKAIGADNLKKGKKGTGIEKVRERENAAYTEMGAIGNVLPDQELGSAIEAVRSKASKSTKRNQLVDKLVDELAGEYGNGGPAKMTADQVVNRVRELRKQGNADLSDQIGVPVDVQVQAQGQARLKLADALDDFLERSAKSLGNDDLASRYRTARKNLAKTGAVENATRAEKVSAQKVFQQREQGAPLEGELADMADINEYFPESTNDAMTADFNGKRADARDIWQLPVVAVQSALRPTISKFLQSDLYQNRFGKASSDASRFADNGDAFDQWPGSAAGDPAIGPPKGVNPPSVNFEGELGVVPDSGPREALPGGNLRGAQSDLRLQEEVTPTGAGPNALRNSPDEINFEDMLLGKVPPYRVQTDMPMVAGPDVRWNPPGESVPQAGDLQLAPDYTPGPHQALPESPGAPTQRADVPRAPQGSSTGNTPVDARLADDDFAQWALGHLVERADAFGEIDDMKLAQQPNPVQQQQALHLAPDMDPVDVFADRYLVPGTTRFSSAPTDGYIGYANPTPGVRQINDAFVREAARGKGIGQKNLVGLAREAAASGDTLNSDVSVTAAQLRAYEAAKKAGLLDFDYFDPDAIAEALQLGGIAKGGEQPVVRNIRPAKRQ